MLRYYYHAYKQCIMRKLGIQTKGVIPMKNGWPYSYKDITYIMSQFNRGC